MIGLKIAPPLLQSEEKKQTQLLLVRTRFLASCESCIYKLQVLIHLFRFSVSFFIVIQLKSVARPTIENYSILTVREDVI